LCVCLTFLLGEFEEIYDRPLRRYARCAAHLFALGLAEAVNGCNEQQSGATAMPSERAGSIPHLLRTMEDQGTAEPAHSKCGDSRVECDVHIRSHHFGAVGSGAETLRVCPYEWAGPLNLSEKVGKKFFER
jgi:hypothetical protein